VAATTAPLRGSRAWSSVAEPPVVVTYTREYALLATPLGIAAVEWPVRVSSIDTLVVGASPCCSQRCAGSTAAVGRSPPGCAEGELVAMETAGAPHATSAPVQS